MKKIYLAGPDVFLPRLQAIGRGNDLKAMCLKHGFLGLYPLDNEVPAFGDGMAQAAWIAGANMRMIDECDYVLANLNNWQGEPDSGTAFEIGYARAKGKDVWAYRDSAAPVEWEPFGCNVNLMLYCNVNMFVGTAEDCLMSMMFSEEME